MANRGTSIDGGWKLVSFGLCVFSGSFGVRSIVLCKCSGKYIDIYFILKVTFHSVLLAMTRDPAEFGWHCWSNTAHPPPSSTTYVAS